MILYDDGFLAELDDNRTLAITGRLSSGKTLLAHELAYRYLRRGYHLASQSLSVWNDDPFGIPMDISPRHLGQRHAFMIFDEGGTYFRTQEQSRAVSFIAAKLDLYLCFAGKKLPHSDLCTLTCQVWFNALKWFWLPFKIWRYDVFNGTKSYSGFFIESAWWDFYGIYDTLDPGDDPIALIRQVEEWTRAYFVAYNRSYSLSDVGGVGGAAEQELANELGQSVQSLSKIASSIPRSQAVRRR